MSAPASPLRVLVVDDDPDAVESLCHLLQRMGCETAACHAGADGLALVRSFEPELAIIDLDMPGMEGGEMVQHLRLQESSSLAMAVCLTGHSLPADRQAALARRFDAIVTKPLLHSTLEDLLARTRQLAGKAPRP